MDKGLLLGQDIISIQAYGLMMILALCLISLWSGSLLLGVARKSERFNMGVNGVLMIAWILIGMLSLVPWSAPVTNALIFLRLYIFHVLFTVWFLMSVRLSLDSERFRALVILSVAFDLIIFLLWATSSWHQLFDFTSDGFNYTHPVMLFLMFINIGKLFAGMMSHLNAWRVRSWSRQIIIIFSLFLLIILFIARIYSGHFVYQQLWGVLALFVYLLLLEISFRTAPTVMNTLSALIFERMERLAFILSESGRTTYLTAGAAKHPEVVSELRPEDIRRALGAGWQKSKYNAVGAYQWRSYDLHGGHLVYLEDIRDREKALRQRDQQLEELHMKKDLLLQRGAMNRELEQFQMRLNILSNIEESISTWLRELSQKIEDLNEEQITAAEVEDIRILCAYIRRRSNLAVTELQEHSLDSGLLRQWCEELLQMGKNQVHLEVPQGKTFSYPMAQSILNVFLELSKDLLQMELWIYGLIDISGKVSLTLSGEQVPELLTRLEGDASGDWKILEDDGDITLTTHVEVPNV